MKGVIGAICERFKQLELKGMPVAVEEPASEDSISNLFRHAEAIDPALKIHSLQKADLASAAKYRQFSERPTRATHYSFQLRKCSADSNPCEWCKEHPAATTERALHWLPCPEPADDKSYQPFQACMMAGSQMNAIVRHFVPVPATQGTHNTPRS